MRTAHQFREPRLALARAGASWRPKGETMRTLSTTNCGALLGAALILGACTSAEVVPVHPVSTEVFVINSDPCPIDVRYCNYFERESAFVIAPANIGEIYARDTSTVTIQGGEVVWARAWNTSASVAINGGVVEAMGTYESSNSTIGIPASATGPRVDNIYMFDSSSLTIASGTIRQNMNVNDSASIVIVGGDYPGETIEGEFFYSEVKVWEKARVTLIGSAFVVDNPDNCELVPHATLPATQAVSVVSEDEGCKLSGVLSSGEAFKLELEPHDAAETFLITNPVE
jgi:hypothetical protein